MVVVLAFRVKQDGHVTHMSTLQPSVLMAIPTLGGFWGLFQGTKSQLVQRLSDHVAVRGEESPLPEALGTTGLDSTSQLEGQSGGRAPAVAVSTGHLLSLYLSPSLSFLNAHLFLPLVLPITCSGVDLPRVHVFP